MISSARYAELEAALDSRGRALLTGGAGYRRARELPGWYEDFDGPAQRLVRHGSGAPAPIAPASAGRSAADPAGRPRGRAGHRRWWTDEP